MKMRTEMCAKTWVENMINGIVEGKLVANSCHADGNVFYSYYTPIAKYENGKFVIASRKYSVTTSKQQTYLARYIPRKMMVVEETIRL